MKILFAAACCVLLTGCTAAGGPPGTIGTSALDGDGGNYAPSPAASYQPPPMEETITTTCTMQGQAVNCR